MQTLTFWSGKSAGLTFAGAENFGLIQGGQMCFLGFCNPVDSCSLYHECLHRVFLYLKVGIDTDECVG